MTNVIFVGLGGFVGAILRYLLGLIPVRQTPFPIITLCINVLGAFVIGLLAALCEKNKINSQPLLLFLKVGLCGGFTTFSTFSLETYDLLSSGRTAPAILYALLSVGLCLLAIFGARALIH
ncbi:MAG: fluoride efflux transporter CrcB [Ruminococcaceae bacterium]|jgi:CrcB protein|nr:fluoride efflux transporter CrcB [Oscillospiraceae bacterium]